MDSFLHYYKSKSGFRKDLHEFINNIPDTEREHLGHRFAFQDYHVEPGYLRHQYLGHIYGSNSFPHFLISLYLSVLVDEVAYTYYKPYYGKFREKTLYPKYRGNCPGGCDHHAHPNRLLDPRSSSHSSEERKQLTDVLRASLADMENEVTSFFEEHIPEVNGREFWQRCKAEIQQYLSK